MIKWWKIFIFGEETGVGLGLFGVINIWGGGGDGVL